MIDVLIIDDCTTVRHMLELVLKHAGDMRVVGVADSALTGLEELERKRPDVITLDLSLPDSDGLEFLDLLLFNPDRREQIIVLTGAEGLAQIARAHGAFACFEKGTLMTRVDQFLQSIRDAAATPRLSEAHLNSRLTSLSKRPGTSAH